MQRVAGQALTGGKVQVVHGIVQQRLRQPGVAQQVVAARSLGPHAVGGTHLLGGAVQAAQTQAAAVAVRVALALALDIRNVVRPLFEQIYLSGKQE